MKIESSVLFDIHSHILPVDDGVENLEEAVATARRSYEQGVRFMMATPHSFGFHYGMDRVRQVFNKLSERIGESIPEMRLSLGCELFCSRENIEDIVNGLSSGKLASMSGTKYVLTEFHTGISEGDIQYCVDHLLSAEWLPIIAHTERFPALFETPEDLKGLHQNALFQINAYSIANERNENIRSRARYLLQNELADFLGSDTHGIGHRPPMWEDALIYMDSHCTRQYAERLKSRNALQLFGLFENSVTENNK